MPAPAITVSFSFNADGVMVAANFSACLSCANELIEMMINKKNNNFFMCRKMMKNVQSSKAKIIRGVNKEKLFPTENLYCNCINYYTPNNEYTNILPAT